MIWWIERSVNDSNRKCTLLSDIERLESQCTVEGFSHVCGLKKLCFLAFCLAFFSKMVDIFSKCVTICCAV